MAHLNFDDTPEGKFLDECIAALKSIVASNEALTEDMRRLTEAIETNDTPGEGREYIN